MGASGRSAYVQAAQGGACVTCVAFVLLLFAVASPYWLWRRSIVWGNQFSTTATLGTGPFVASASSATVATNGGYGWGSDWLYWSDVNDNACDAVVSNASFAPLFDRFGTFFCEGDNDGKDGEFELSSDIKTLQAFLILATILSGLASIAGCCVGKQGSKLAGVAAIFSFLAFISCIVAFSVAAASDYYDGLRDGSAGLLLNDSDGSYIVVSTPDGFYWGGGFYCTIVAAIVLGCGTPSMCFINRKMEDDDLDGNEDNAQQQDQQQQQQQQQEQQEQQQQEDGTSDGVSKV